LKETIVVDTNAANFWPAQTFQPRERVWAWYADAWRPAAVRATTDDGLIIVSVRAGTRDGHVTATATTSVTAEQLRPGRAELDDIDAESIGECRYCEQALYPTAVPGRVTDEAGEYICPSRSEVPKVHAL
jgi:hypothetical protein